MKPKPSEFPNLPERLRGLEELADNLWWSWHPGARMLFKMLNRQAWKESGHNPDRMLREMPVEILEAAAGNQDYLRNYDVVLSQFRRYMSPSTCQYLNFVAEPNTYAVAYFSAEYGLHRSLPFYAGGLGFLAGDHLKECSDLGVPLVAVGFMYPQGYLHQSIREDGWWIEGFNGQNGWAFGHNSCDGNRNAADAAEIYRILEDKIIPLYYDVSEDGVPRSWVKVMKNSIKSNAAKFSARRMVKEYIEKFYARGLQNITGVST